MCALCGAVGVVDWVRGVSGCLAHDTVLCWWQRIFLYPQVFLLGFAAHRKDAGMAFYSIVLSGLGLLVALYHHALQMGRSCVLSVFSLNLAILHSPSWPRPCFCF